MSTPRVGLYLEQLLYSWQLIWFIPGVRRWERKNCLWQIPVKLLNEVLQGVWRQQDGVRSRKVTLLEAAVLSQDLASPQRLSLLPTQSLGLQRIYWYSPTIPKVLWQYRSIRNPFYRGIKIMKVRITSAACSLENPLIIIYRFKESYHAVPLKKVVN